MVHHIGVSVADLERSVAFWTSMLGVPGRDRRILEGPQLGPLLGYPSARIDSCWFDLPGGVALELLQYLEPVGEAIDPATANPGNVHVCFRVTDIDAAQAHAVAAGATPTSAAPIQLRAGRYPGTRMSCLRDPDGVTIELLSRP
ncbi:MAG TPA: VOC family protein [Candidatus Dormibacteraeota bacterium]|nr:VOC family protein [Candidatus Dormibacteraeota bacterium]